MIHSKAATALIASFEGRRAQAYPDPATGGDPWTIGVGHTGPEVHKGLVWTDAQIDAALDADLTKFDRGVSDLIGSAPTSQNEFDALVSFAFNLGLGNLAKSTLLSRHKVGDKAGAAVEFLKWNRAGGQPMKGLTRRRQAESDLYRGKVA
jgi:lysozyme